MNNLKRVLSLGLTGAMLAGLLTVGASAADFTDVDKIQHDEAVNVLVALKIIDGKPDGSFDPEGNVTRAEMAKMIAVAMNGGNDANTGTKTSPSFTDIGGHWAESYIEYCHDLGIISGRGDGTFDPGANVTGLEATKMVLSALGFDAEAYKLTGASWAVRTDEVARTMTGLGWTSGTGSSAVFISEPSMYDDLAGVMMANAASRDTAAQLIWNGLQNRTRTVQPTTNKNSGEVEWTYITNTSTLLNQRYDANVQEGVFLGNEKSNATTGKGEIVVDPDVGANWSFPSDFDITNIGEKVKVVWKDGSDSKNGKPDKRDTIYGVFNTGKTEVYHITMNDMQDAKSDLNKGKIKFGGATYEIAGSGVEVTFNYDSTPYDVDDAPLGVQTYGTAKSLQDLLKQQSIDEVKFVVKDEADDLDDGKIYKAYVTQHFINRVSGASASKVVLQNVGSIEVADNDVYEGIAKDDVVTYTRLYNNEDKDKAYFTIAKAETVEGQLTGFKRDKYNNVADCYVNIVVDGETIKVESPATTLRNNLTEDYVSTVTDVKGGAQNSNIGDTVRVYKLGDMVGCVQSISSEGGKYALVTEVSESGEVGSNMDPLRVTVVFADGTESTLLVHKDSTYGKLSGTNTQLKIKDLAQTNQVALFDMVDDGSGTKGGNLIEYSSVSNGTIKIKTVASVLGTNFDSKDVVGNGGSYTIGYNATKGENNTIWNEDSKKLTVSVDGSKYADEAAVASTDAVLFTAVDRDSNNDVDGKVDNYYASSLRGAGSLYAEYQQVANKVAGATKDSTVQYFTDTKGLVTAASMLRSGKAVGNKEDTLYGIVTGFKGTFHNDKGEEYWKYSVAVGRDEDVEVRILEDSSVEIGNLVVFDERSDMEYTKNVTLHVLVPTADTPTTSVGDDGSFELAAVREYNKANSLLLYYGDTYAENVNDTFDNGTEKSVTIAKDAKFYYVNGDKNTQGDELSGDITEYAIERGYANALLHITDKGVVDVVIVETSGKGNLAHPTTKNEGTGSFGARYAATMPAAAPTITSKDSADYEVTMTPAKDAKAVVGSTVTLSIKCKTAPAKGETIALGASTDFDAVKGSVHFDKDDAGTTKDITLTVKAAAKDKTLSFTLETTKDTE